ncbi:hypothetical protein BDW22DRAFT_1354594 [Trametopsis cervina]|nr:hypothetical protein BDW22DRAFT_1354594 [Trametopsis cervina]
MKYKGIICAILQADANEFPEYRVTTEEAKRQSSCCIASQAGKNFKITFKVNKRVPPAQSDFVGRVFIDGQCIGSYELPCTKSSVRATATTQRPFMFAPVALTDDEDAPRLVDGEELGSIKVEIFPADVRPVRATNRSRVKAAAPQRLEERLPKLRDAPVHETSKKGGAHRTLLGEEIQSRPRSTTGSIRWIVSADCDQPPHCTFVFRYSSVELLKAQGIIPLDVPAPIPVAKRPAPVRPEDASSKGPSKRPRTDSSTESKPPKPSASSSRVKIEDTLDLEALRAQREALEAQIRQAEAALIMKREVSPILLGAGNGDMIDLTEDD